MPLPRSGAPPTLCLVVLLACGGAGDPIPDAPASTSPADAAATPSAPLFVDATGEWGVDFVHDSGASGELSFPEMMGGGVAVFDADGDGDLDLYFVSGAARLGRDPAADGSTNRLFLQAEDGRYRDATESSGLGDRGFGTGVAIGDVDNDGNEDVFVANFGQDRLYLGRGDARFEDATVAAGLSSGNVDDDWSTSAAFCDLDRDGHLDLYVVRYVVLDPGLRCTDKAGRAEYCGPDNYLDRTDQLWLNRGDGRFRDVTATAGIDDVTGAGLGVVCDDLDDDGWSDVYVANDGDPNQLWMNQGPGPDGVPRFLDDALIMGASVNAAGLHEAGMGVVAADFDNDADLDLFLTHLRDETNTFYLNLGPGTGFEDRTVNFGLAAASTPYTGFGTAPLDFDLDGDLDLVISNGRVKKGPPLTDALPEPWNQYAEPNLVYRNDGDSFALLQAGVEALLAQIEVGRGLATGDLDGDGDLDLVLSNIESPARLYRALAPSRHWLIVDAFDPALRRRALGAKITVTSAQRSQVRSLQGAMSYLSASDPRAHFGLGEDAAPVDIRVRWPGGDEESFSGVSVDQAIVLRRGEGVE